MQTIAGVAGTPSSAIAEGFDHWLTSKSFSMLAPMCRLGLVVVLAMLTVFDPILYLTGVWGSQTQHFFLIVWHACALIYFLLFLALSRRGATHLARTRWLIAFFVASAALFSWFGFISWMLSGDLSIYAIFLLSMVCVFCFPGRLRQVINITSSVALAIFILWLDPRGTFYASGAALNLAALTVVALLLDGFLMAMNRALYDEKCRVEFERSRADHVLYNALPVSIAEELKNNNIVKAQKYQNMAVLFVDVVGFTQFSASRPPDTVVQVLNEIFSTFDTLVDRYDVEKIKTIGDAYMVIGKDNLASVARLALELLDCMELYNRRTGFNLPIRCGIHVGPTVAGVIGLKRFLYDVWGDAVNTASRMESLGVPGRIQVSEAVYAELVSQFRFEDRGEIEVKGKGIMRTYFLLGHQA